MEQIRRYALHPVTLLAALACLYFYRVFVGDVLVGLDAGDDYHLGESETALQKIAQLSPPQWKSDMGGMPEADNLRWEYFPTYLIYLFTSYHRHLAIRYLLTMFAAGLFIIPLVLIGI
mgnify:FL=1